MPNPQNIEDLPNIREYLEKKKQQYGNLFNPSDLEPRFAPYFLSEDRIKVRWNGAGSREEVAAQTGRVGVSTGWKPVFLLLHNSRSLGSSAILDHRMRLLAVKRAGSRKYEPVDE